MEQKPQTELTTPDTSDLLRDLRTLIEQTRERVATTVNRELTLLYWRIGNRIREDILKSGRADYGTEIVPTV